MVKQRNSRYDLGRDTTRQIKHRQGKAYDDGLLIRWTKCNETEGASGDIRRERMWSEQWTKRLFLDFLILDLTSTILKQRGKWWVLRKDEAVINMRDSRVVAVHTEKKDTFEKSNEGRGGRSQENGSVVNSNQDEREEWGFGRKNQEFNFGHET